MNSSTVVVIGATSGVGLATAQQLSDAGHHVLAIGRDPGRAHSLRHTLTRTGDSSAIDISTQSGWNAAADWISNRTDRVDTLVNAAGVMFPTRQTTPDGIELNFAIHHLAPFALTSRLLPLIRRGSIPDGPEGRSLPRVVNINSVGHRMSMAGHIDPVLDFDDLQAARHYDPFLAYSQSKLANLLFTYELARHHGHELAVVALHPGVVRSDLGRHFPKLQVAAAQAFAISPRRAARSVVQLGTGPLPENGRYYERDTQAQSSSPSHDRVAAARLWTLTETMCGQFDRTPDFATGSKSSDDNASIKSEP